MKTAAVSEMIAQAMLAVSMPIFFVGCTTGAPVDSSAIRPKSSEHVATGPDLRAFQRVLFEVERAYVERPDFAAMAVGAVRALEDLAADGAFRLIESERETSVSYRVAGGERRTITFGRQITREQAVEDLMALFLLARETNSAVPALDLERAMIVRALRRLDPDSSFLDPETYREMQRETAGDFGGAGLELTFRGGSLTVVAPIEGAPAHRAGVQPGDRVEKIDGLATKGMSLPDVIRRLRGRSGTKVTMTVAREGWPEPQMIEITREQMRVSSVVARGLGDGVAYIRLRQFQEQTPHDLDRVLEPFARAGMKALILDLRNNSGGLLTAAIEVAEMFLETGKLVTYTEGRLRNQNMRFSAHAKKAYTAMPMVALVNQGSAAGTEIVAGALQDWARASLLGTQTFGRASIQTIIPLSDGSGLRLTTARWFTPKGRSVHGKGLAPDLTVEGRDVPSVTAVTREEELLALDVQIRSALEHLTRLIVPKPER